MDSSNAIWCPCREKTMLLVVGWWERGREIHSDIHLVPRISEVASVRHHGANEKKSKPLLGTPGKTVTMAMEQKQRC